MTTIEVQNRLVELTNRMIVLHYNLSLTEDENTLDLIYNEINRILQEAKNIELLYQISFN